MAPATLRPSVPFVAASWIAFLTGAIAFMVGLTNAKMMLNEQGYYLTVLLFSLLPILMTGLFVFWYRRRIRMPQSPLENP